MVAADAARLGPAAEPARATRARGRGAGAAAGGRRLPGLPARRPLPRPTLESVARFLLYESAYPGSVASSVEALRDALATADAQPRSSPPVLRLGRLIADLELQRRTPGERRASTRLLERVQDELELDRSRHRRALLRDRRARGRASVGGGMIPVTR